jgi:hypothetical protein
MKTRLPGSQQRIWFHDTDFQTLIGSIAHGF